jgi:hypothetical protein
MGEGSTQRCSTGEGLGTGAWLFRVSVKRANDGGKRYEARESF